MGMSMGMGMGKSMIFYIQLTILQYAICNIRISNRAGGYSHGHEHGHGHGYGALGQGHEFYIFQLTILQYAICNIQFAICNL
jgi:hypothetical protein